MWGNSRLGYWRIANSPILAKAIGNDSLRKARLQGFGHILGQILFAVYDLHIEQFADQSKKHQGKDDCQGKYPGTCDFFYCFLQNF